MMIKWGRWTVLTVTSVLMILGIARGALDRYEEKRRAILDQCAKDQQRLGLVDRVQLFAKYPTPEVRLVTAARLLPGGTGQLVALGKFQSGTRFLLASDTIEIVKEEVTPTEYRATLRAPAGLGPEDAGLEIYAPVSAGRAAVARVAFVAGGFEWQMKADNGWRVQARLKEDTRGAQAGSEGEMKYAMEFFREGESEPFEQRTATLHFSPYGAWNYTFAIAEASPIGADVQGELERIGRRLSDMSISPDERAKLTNRMMELAQKAAEQGQQATQPAGLQQMQARMAQFGCESLSLMLHAGNLEGTLYCSQSAGGRIRLTGAMKSAAQ